jgi:hypothetical protein
MKKASVPSILIAVLMLAVAVMAEGAAAEESPSDRIPGCCLPFHYLGPHRGIPTGSARPWIRGGEKHCH